MNKHWIDFLDSHHATITPDLNVTFPEDKSTSQQNITVIFHLSILQVSGKDAAQFLQGQLTCNIHNLTESISFFTAFCNAKGRTISTLLVCKKEDMFYLILPSELINKVSAKLKMYILRSDVLLQDMSTEFGLLGLSSNQPSLLPHFSEESFASHDLMIKLPSSKSRYLIIRSADKAATTWNTLQQSHQLTAINSAHWKNQDIADGIPWLTQSTSEAFIPQMLNIDKLGGISFDKGCYTGQEVVARTHYLGKAKRELSLAECQGDIVITDETQILNQPNGESAGKILAYYATDKTTRLLLVMKNIAEEKKPLILNTAEQDKVLLIPFQ